MEIPLTREALADAMYRTIVSASTSLPEDVTAALRRALDAEEDTTARLHLTTTFENIELAQKEGRLTCADTGYPFLFLKLGRELRFDGSPSLLYDAAKDAVARATGDAKLRPTMVHPILRTNPGDNIGHFLPKVELRFDDSVEGIEITAVPKGGGSEIFGSFYQMMVPADGIAGVMKFILDCAEKAVYGGKVCPPAVIGVGIGGSSDICMRIAKEAAVLRPIGQRHPEPDIAELEERLERAVNSLGVGPMGFRGKTAALALNIEYAVTHTAALPVAFNAQCSICRRATSRLLPDGTLLTGIPDPAWHYR